MTATRCVSAVIAGLFLATLPFWRYLPITTAGAHTDHEPRHGGQLGMVGDHHVELVRRRGRIEVFVSDARRRPVRPNQAWVIFDHQGTTPLTWENHRFVGADQRAMREVEARAILPDASEIAIGFDFNPDVSTARR